MRATRGLVAVLIGATLAAVGCSFTRSDAACDSVTDCRTAFGPGYVCTEGGLCEPAALEPSCQNQLPADLLIAPSKYKDWVLIGSLLRATGKEGARHDAAKLAVDAANDFLQENASRYPQLEGLRFGLIQCDSDGATQEVARLAGYLTDTLEVPLLLGPASSSRVDAAFQEVNLTEEGDERRRALFMTPSGTSVALTTLESERPGLLWRTAPMDDGQGRLMGAYAAEQGMPLAVFYEDTTYGRGLYAELDTAAADLCNDCGISFEADTPDIVSLARAIASNEGRAALENASIVVFIGAQETHIREMLSRLTKPELDGKLLFLSDAAASSETFSKLSPSAKDRVLGTRVSPPPDTESLRFFTSAYEAVYEESALIHSFTANAYDATWLLIVGSIWALLDEGEVTAEGAARGLRRLSDPTFLTLDADDCPLPLAGGSCPELTLDYADLGAMVDSFLAGRAINVRGASGSLDYCASDEELERELSAFELWRLEETGDSDGPYRIVGAPGPDSPAEALPPCPATEKTR